MNSLPVFVSAITFIGGLYAGYLTAYFKYVFDAEKSRFDFRMQILQRLWKATVYVRSLAANIDPASDFIDPNESPDARRERRLEEFFPAHLKAKKILRFNQPFYPEPLHDMASNILLEAWSLARFIADRQTRMLKSYRNIVDERTELINRLTNEFREAIRAEVHRSPLKL
jgi:hypothetical protein